MRRIKIFGITVFSVLPHLRYYRFTVLPSYGITAGNLNSGYLKVSDGITEQAGAIFKVS